MAAAAAEGLEMVPCECCGMREECTTEYIARVRARYGGRWVCGLCAEAVKEEARREGRRISPEEALARHTRFVEACRAAAAAATDAGANDRLIAVMRKLLRRSIDSPRGGGFQSTPSSPISRNGVAAAAAAKAALARSESCFPALAQ